MSPFSKLLTTKLMLSLSGAMSLFLLVTLHFFYSPLPDLGSREVIRLQMSFHPRIFLENLYRWGPEGIERFLLYMPLDFYFPIFYGLFFAGLLAHHYGRHWIIWLPLLSTLFDILENSTHVLLLRDRLALSPWVLYASLFACFKYGLLLTSWVLLTPPLLRKRLHAFPKPLE